MAPAPPSTGSLLPEVAGFLASLRVEKGATAHTIRSYQLDLEQFLAWLVPGGATVSHLASVSSLTVREYLAWLQRQALARRTLARKLSSLRSFFWYLCRTGVLPANPAEGVSAPRPQPEAPAFVAETDMDRLLSLPDTATDLGLRDRALLELLYATGMRVGELVALTPGHLDLCEGWVTTPGSAGQQREVPLGARAMAALAEYLARSRPALAARAAEPADAGLRGQPLFLNRWGTALTDRSVRRLLQGYMERLAGLARVTPRAIRHSFAVHLLSRGADLRAVQEMLGHTRMASTQVYARLPREPLRQEYRRAHPRERKVRQTRPTEAARPDPAPG